MSSSSREVTGKKKKDVWQEAGGEFYQERYPCGSGQATSTADLTETPDRRVTRPHIPLPSQTARRNSFIPTGRKYYTRKQSMTATFTATNCMTYNSTMGGVANGNELHVALMPDLADETIPNEKTTYEALLKIKALPEPMNQKRLRKAKISGIPQLRLTGWRRLKWDLKKGLKYLKRSWSHENRNFVLFQSSLELIELRCGTSIVNVFLFIKWTMFLNLFISCVIALFIIFPYMASNPNVVSRALTPGSNCNISIEDTAIYTNLQDRMECCAKAYQIDINNSNRGSLGTITRLLFKFTGIENSPFFYGYYIHINREPKYDLFAVSYALVFTFILLFCLLLMVRSVGMGIQEMILASEGEHHQYTNLIFAGWDNYTKDDAGALFKRKILRHEMKVALMSETRNLESLIRNKKQRIKLNAMRILVNLIVFVLLLVAGVIIFLISGLSMQRKKTSFANTTNTEHFENLAYGFAPSVIISFFNLIFPIILAKLGKLEKFSVQTETALVLIRALFIRLMSIGFVAVKFYLVAYCELKNDDHCVICKEEDTHKQSHCWESLFADQVYRLILIDLLIKCVLTFLVDPFRLQLKKFFKCKICQKLGTMKFNIVRHSLDVIYIQVLSWLGMYFGPIIPILCILYCFAVFYIKKYSVLHNCTAVPDTYKTMKTTTIFVAAKLMAFIAVTFANVGVIGYMMPSRGCGPFRKYNRAWAAVKELINTNDFATNIYDHIASPGITTPVTMALILIAYYYYAVAQANRGMVDTLRHLLILEGHDKQYLFARLNSLRRQTPNSARSEESRINAHE